LENAIQKNLQSIWGLSLSDVVHGQVVFSCARGHKIRMSETSEKIVII